MHMNDTNDKLEDYEDFVLPMEFEEITKLDRWYFIGAVGAITICIVAGIVGLICWLV